MLIKSWKVDYNGKMLSAKSPCSIYSVLNDNNLMPNYLYGLNESSVKQICEFDYDFYAEFDADSVINFTHKKIIFNGLDTICDVYLNGEFLLYCDNMHRKWEIDVSNLLKLKSNIIKIHFYSPIKYITDKQQKNYLFAQPDPVCMQGISHIRKANSCFGWDWGPQYPDMGIWKEVELIGYNDYYLEDMYFNQKHFDGKVLLSVNTTVLGGAECDVEITNPSGEKLIGQTKNGKIDFLIENPKLWYPNGYGEQNLYKIIANINGEKEQSITKTCGLRTVTISQEPDQYGREFCFVVNGIKIFAMGANYVPSDSVFPYITKNRLEKIILDCVKANHNCIRIWGGGVYGSDEFYDLCDKYGLLVWQDFAFACETVVLYKKYKENIVAEFIDNLKRIRNHPSLALLCGNNEIEQYVHNCVGNKLNIDKAKLVLIDYLELFERLLPDICEEYAPEIFYWPSSPSSGGGFYNTDSENIGDVHSWKVWFSAPIQSYRNNYPRFVSEFGFQAYPDIKTCNSFLPIEERNPFSATMDAHQKSKVGNAKLSEYMSKEYRYPCTFDNFVYLSQILQGEAVKTCVEHLRRNRGRCMGAIYWQLNDEWTAASWSSLDYYGRWKALHYYSKRFFAPTLLSLDDCGMNCKFNVSTESKTGVSGYIVISVKENDFSVIYQKKIPFILETAGAKIVYEEDFSPYFESNKDSRFLSFELYVDDKLISSDSHIFVKSKEYKYNNAINAEFIQINGEKYVKVFAKNYAQRVEINSLDYDFVLSDNYFDVISDKELLIKCDSEYSIEQLNSSFTIKSLNIL